MRIFIYLLLMPCLLIATKRDILSSVNLAGIGNVYYSMELNNKKTDIICRRNAGDINISTCYGSSQLLEYIAPKNPKQNNGLALAIESLDIINQKNNGSSQKNSNDVNNSMYNDIYNDLRRYTTINIEPYDFWKFKDDLPSSAPYTGNVVDPVVVRE